MNQQQALSILEETRALIIDSHIVYTSGRHGKEYVNKDALYPHTMATSALCRSIAEEFSDQRVDFVIAPAIGGVILSQWVAHHLTILLERDVYALYAEKSPDGSFIVSRGYDKYIPDKCGLVVEDILTTGGSALKVIQTVRALGGNVVGLGALCNRGGITAGDVGDVPKFHALINVALDSWPEAECPLCRQGVPINTSVGKGKEFLARTCR
jgi:orotate phosphoribosyltransferase